MPPPDPPGPNHTACQILNRQDEDEAVSACSMGQIETLKRGQ